MEIKSKKDDVILTIFTPAYNRAHTLSRTYKSLKAQDNKQFVWMIVDDGSKDNTRELVDGWKKETNEFEIIYIYKENGGMHTAHNLAYENITTELNVCIDSDDMLAPGAVNLILKKWNDVKNDGYAGIVGTDINMSSGEVIGKDFDDDVFETTLSDYYASGGKGDKKQVYRTEIINKYPPYPVFEGEKYFSLSYKYLLIDQEYKLAVINEPLCIVEYQQDGSSNNMFRQYFNNPNGFAEWRKIRMKYDKTLKRKVIDCIHYCSSCFLAGKRNIIRDSPQKMLTFVCIPFGAILSLIIKIKVSSMTNEWDQLN